MKKRNHDQIDRGSLCQNQKVCQKYVKCLKSCFTEKFIPRKPAKINYLQNLSENFSTHLLTVLTIHAIFHSDKQKS